MRGSGFQFKTKHTEKVRQTRHTWSGVPGRSNIPPLALDDLRILLSRDYEQLIPQSYILWRL
jgi:hypothetical protein